MWGALASASLALSSPAPPSGPCEYARNQRPPPHSCTESTISPSAGLHSLRLVCSCPPEIPGPSVGALASEHTKLSVPFIDELGIRPGFRHLLAESTVERPSIFVIASMTDSACQTAKPMRQPLTRIVIAHRTCPMCLDNPSCVMPASLQPTNLL